MNQSEKYEAFRNFMFNELGVSKEEIRTWIKEAVQEQITNLVQQQCGKFDVQKLTEESTKRYMHSSLLYEIRNKTLEVLRDKIILSFKE